MAKIELNGLAHSYMPHIQEPQDFALKELNHVWEDGGAYALLGPSGCGKTTLLNIISGLLKPTHGEILFDGEAVTNKATEDRNIAQVFQFPVVYDTMTVYDNLAFPLRNRGVGASEVDGRVREIAELLEMSDSLKRKASGLTADAKQKISLGRGLVRADVSAILFDEPLTVIDPHLKWQLRSQLKHLHKRFNYTMVYVTHDQTEALTFADKVVVMYDGAVVQMGTPEELFERPKHTFVGYFIGSPGMNVVPCHVDGKQAMVADHAFAMEQGLSNIPEGASLEVGIRPEFLSLSREGSGPTVSIQKVEDLGRFKVASVRLEDHEFKVMVNEEDEVPTDGARLVVDPTHVNLYANSHLVEEA
ncbi:ABC transporter ATP-binding protein [Kiloniella litopenaei]|uniref:ABC transporter ATP-binding protein n=1 Tax=Kiloniella litopenaei TaxID=1549748 RepID=A0A0M2R9P2_9PROT|nr:ABC transporter ATP-binding protein [Kiloniella litopenaei]KKJ77159.1 ABC transporter ATP-binding protein [Kiloniella litopenaei]